MGSWLALVYWDTQVGPNRHVNEQWVPLADIAQIPGEDYSAVPTLT
ncbi:hypothetical protein [Streptosporangium sp. G12]